MKKKLLKASRGLAMLGVFLMLFSSAKSHVLINNSPEGNLEDSILTGTKDCEIGIICPSNITVNVDPGKCGAVVNIPDPDITGDCSGASFFFSIATGSFFAVGTTSVTATAQEDSGNSASCSFNITVIDNEPPVLVCQPSVVLQLDANGEVPKPNPYLSGILISETDNCAIVGGLGLTGPGTFTCAFLGSNKITIIQDDPSGNVGTCIVDMIVVDNLPPTAVCKNATVALNASGEASIIPVNIDGGSYDNCGLRVVNISTFKFDCSNLGTNMTTFTVFDFSDNEAFCTSTVTVVDNLAPNAVCKDITVELNGLGEASIGPGSIDGGSTDNCDIVFMAIDGGQFLTCADIGTHTFNLTLRDQSGNTSSCSAQVTVVDKIPPTITCLAPPAINNLPGQCQAYVILPVPSTGDNCFVKNLTNDFTGLPSANAFYPVGTTLVTWTVTDRSGNSTNCTVDVVVNDVEDPIARCQDITIQLDATGNASITPGDVDGGSSDNCVVTSSSVSPNLFTCSDIGDNSVTLMVADNTGNPDNCSATVTVEDNIAPTVLCKAARVRLNKNGRGVLRISQIVDFASDNCGVKSFMVSQRVFDCSDLGENTVTVRVEDESGNPAECQASVEVVDRRAPDALCKNITIYLNENGEATITPLDINDGSSDNCGIESIGIRRVLGFETAPLSSLDLDCDDQGENSFQLILKDGSGNESSCEATVQVDGQNNCNDGTTTPDPGPDGWGLLRNTQSGSDGLMDVKLQAYPNPFNESIRLSFNLSEDDQVSLRIFDSGGRLVKKLFEGPLGAGTHNMGWSGESESRGEVVNGLYFARFESSRGSKVIRILKIN